MSRFSTRYLSLLAVAAALLVVAAFLLFRKTPPPPISVETPPPAPLSELAVRPNWQELEPYQNTVSRQEFETLLSAVFTTGQNWRNLIDIRETEALIQTGEPAPSDIFHLQFAATEATNPPRPWKSAAELPPTSREFPLAGLRIAIDPGHIGGNWAKMEERWFVVGDGSPVCEGDMTLRVAQLLKPRLEALGAVVSLVREKPEPVTEVRPVSLISQALESKSPTDPEPLSKIAERLFYRTAEIHARAKLVNDTLKPDLVLCLHFNAESWGNPNQPTLIDHTHMHVLINGAYDDHEISLADQRFSLLQKILQRGHQEELQIGSTVSQVFAEKTGLPAYQYPPESTSVRALPGQPYLWARNLLANRLYHCPVIFLEPYVMNSTIDYARIQAGDYEGLREIGGKMQPSIFLEYADSVAQGLAAHYLKSRKFSD